MIIEERERERENGICDSSFEKNNLINTVKKTINKNKVKKIMKKNQRKLFFYDNYSSKIKNKIKKELINIINISKQLIVSKSRSALIITLLILLFVVFVMSFGNIIISIFSRTTSSILTTTYLSSEETLHDINNYFTSLEENLYYELENVENHHTGYDEYIVNGKELIGHNVHELLSFITSSKGNVEDVLKISNTLDDLFNSMYSISYKEEIEIKIREVDITHTDKDGNCYTVTVEEEYEYKKLIVTLTKKEMDVVIREIFYNYPDNLIHYEALLQSEGNMSDCFGSSKDLSRLEVVDTELNFDDLDIDTKALFEEAKKHLGKRYVFGSNGPDTFDCSSFVCYVFRHSVFNMPRVTAQNIFDNYCYGISQDEAKEGDIIFFKNTYNSSSIISHVGIYLGNGMMIHAGDPVQITSINKPYWKNHFYSFGRVKKK